MSRRSERLPKIADDAARSLRTSTCRGLIMRFRVSARAAVAGGCHLREGGPTVVAATGAMMIAAMTVAACDGETGAAGGPVVRDSAGVRLVEYAGAPQHEAPFALSAEPVYRHGSDPGDTCSGTSATVRCSPTGAGQSSMPQIRRSWFSARTAAATSCSPDPGRVRQKWGSWHACSRSGRTACWSTTTGTRDSRCSPMASLPGPSVSRRTGSSRWV